MIDLEFDLIEFHNATEVPVRSKPVLPTEDEQALRFNLITEEFHEVLDALTKKDLPEIAKELVDLVYVTIGTAVQYGIPFNDVWEEVHASNMAKVDPVTGKVRRREDGKVLKPEGWQKPDIKKVLGIV